MCVSEGALGRLWNSLILVFIHEDAAAQAGEETWPLSQSTSGADAGRDTQSLSPRPYPRMDALRCLFASMTLHKYRDSLLAMSPQTLMATAQWFRSVIYAEIPQCLEPLPPRTFLMGGRDTWVTC